MSNPTPTTPATPTTTYTAAEALNRSAQVEPQLIEPTAFWYDEQANVGAFIVRRESGALVWATLRVGAEGEVQTPSYGVTRDGLATLDANERALCVSAPLWAFDADPGASLTQTVLNPNFAPIDPLDLALVIDDVFLMLGDPE